MNATAGELWVERKPGADGADMWVVSAIAPERLPADAATKWLTMAGEAFARRPEVATISIVTRKQATTGALATELVEAEVAALPVCIVNARVGDLLGMPANGAKCGVSAFQAWVETATRKGLVHGWLVGDWPPVEMPFRAVPEPRPGASTNLVPALPSPAHPPFALGIDAAWLLGGESGAQVFVFEMLKELVRRPEVARVVLFSDSGQVPRALEQTVKVSGATWQSALNAGGPVVDILHRPYQPGADVDYGRYHAAAPCVALTVLDFIAYDNPVYHESIWAWRQYQRAFDESVCAADCVFAISRYVGSRIERQFAHRLSGPVRPVPLGTDHLAPAAGSQGSEALSPATRALESSEFLLVLGNDFEHKNRDFAVRVFARMRDRGYRGRLVLAGFHLDDGSSYGHELTGAGPHAEQVVRMGAVSPADKTWLLQHAGAVLYPTSSEGFGLVPFEAAALGVPTAFVAFGPLLETLPGVPASSGWQVEAFADHVFTLLADPATHVARVRAAGAALTWAGHADQVLDGYQALLAPGARWRSAARDLPGPWARAVRQLDAMRYRIVNKLRRVTGLSLSRDTQRVL